MTLSQVHPSAQLGTDVKIGPFCFIEEDVIIGDYTIIEPHVTIYSGSRIGNNCHIFPGAVIGAPPQDLGFKGEKTTVEIGNHVIIREQCTLHRGTTDKWKTTVGDHCFLMAYSHIAHDCQVGEHCIFANAVNLAGHVEVGEYTTIGGVVGVHQFCHIGKQTMVAAGVIVRKDVPHYIKIGRDPVSYIGVNSIGLKRRGFSQEAIDQINNIYRLLFVKHRNRKKAIQAILSEIPDSSYREEILGFIEASNRGLVKGL